MNYKILYLLILSKELTFDQIFTYFKSTKKEIIEKSLNYLKIKKIIFFDDNSQLFKLVNKYKNKLGVYHSTKNGYGFIHTDDQTSYFVPEKLTNNANQNDIVYFFLKPDKKNPDQKVAKIISVLLHETNKILGKIEIEKEIVNFISAKQNSFIYKIKNFDPNIFKNNDWVLASVVSKNQNMLTIDLKENLGNENSVDLLYNLALKKNNIQKFFSRETIEEADKLKVNLKEELKKRKDFRDQLVVTIDGIDAKDLDDAFYVEKKNNFYNLYIHIADVSHFVKEGSAIDKDAFNKSTSVYLIDKVIPMLPFNLSNNLCSLNLNGPKLAMTLKIVISKDGKVSETSFYESIIQSKARLNYAEVNQMFYKKINLVRSKEVTDMLLIAKELSDKLKNIYHKDGMIDFIAPETKIILDQKRKPKELKIKTNDIAENLIENFMIASNVAVANIFYKNKVPITYRIHERPKSEKMKNLNLVLKSFGYLNFNFESQNLNQVYQTTTEWLLKKDFQIIANKFLIQSMEKARYSENNLGHFGLGLKNYTHFTSPIRRYPDLIAHRYLKKINNLKIDKNILKNKMKMFSEQTSNKERKAIMAERYLSDALKALYMKDYIGEKYMAFITNITKKGIFIELENSVNGFVDFQFEDTKGILINENSSTIKLPSKFSDTKSLGDKINVLVENVNPVEGKVLFSLV